MPDAIPIAFPLLLILSLFPPTTLCVKKCFDVPTIASSCESITPTTMCANFAPDYTQIDTSTLKAAQAARKAACDDPHYRTKQCPNDPREADLCERDGPAMTEHCGGDEILCASDAHCAARLICWERCYPCQTKKVCDTLVDIGIVAPKGTTKCISQNRCYQVDDVRAGDYCSGLTPARVCTNHRPNLQYVTEEYVNNLHVEWEKKCGVLNAHDYAVSECPNDPSAARPCHVVYPEPTKERLCMADPAFTSICEESMDCPRLLKPCWNTCYPCKTRAHCEQLVARGELAEETESECSSAAVLSVIPMYIVTFVIACILAV